MKLIHKQNRHGRGNLAQKKRTKIKKTPPKPKSTTIDGINMMHQMVKTIEHFFPKLWGQLGEIADSRSTATYSIASIVMSGICLFLFKSESRHEFNLTNRLGRFARNFKKAFGFDVPHMDTVHDVMKVLPTTELEQMKVILVRQLIEKKVLHKFRLESGALQVAVDATRTHSFKERHCDECLSTTHTTFKLTQKCLNVLAQENAEAAARLQGLKGQSFKTKDAMGKLLRSHLQTDYSESILDTLVAHCDKKVTTNYFHAVLEAKIVCANGFCISIASEWISNAAGHYDKQDCERNAFKRLAAKLKAYFPKLKICILADGLYPNKPVFDICKAYEWDFIFSFKSKSLPNLRKEIETLKPFNMDLVCDSQRQVGQRKIHSQYQWLTQLDYETHSVSWLRCHEVTSRGDAEIKLVNFEYVTNIDVKDAGHAVALVNSGRLRQKIENEGFNTQKNHGHGLKHKYSRRSTLALKNYYQCMQIAHLFEQLCFLEQRILEAIQSAKLTMKHCFREMVAVLKCGHIDGAELELIKAHRTQYRY